MADKNSGKSRKKGGAVYLIIIVILLCVIAFSLYNIGKILFGYWEGRSTYTRIAEEAGARPGRDDVEVKFNKLRKKYPDVKAWLYTELCILDPLLIF